MTSNRVHWRTVATGLLVAAVLAACGGDDDEPEDASRPTTTTTAGDGTATTPDAPSGPSASSASAALEALLTAEQAGDHAASYALLSSRAKRDYPNVDEWARDRQQLAPITSFEVRSEDEGVVEALVEHTPGLDPFVGLSVGRETQRWEAVEEDGRWVLDAPPEIEPLFPDEEEAIAVSQAWIDAAVACDGAALTGLEGVAQLFGTAGVRDELCDSDLQLEAGDVDEVRSGPASSELVTQYSSDALVWARSVTADGGATTLELILAPLGDDWRVIGVIAGE